MFGSEGQERERDGWRVREANRLFFDTVADVYEVVDGRRGEDIVWWLDEVIGNLARAAGHQRLLDVGCGTGLVVRIAARHFAQVYGVDISINILARVKTFATGVATGDVSCLPFADESFDAVSCFAVLHHLYDHGALLREVYRILRPKGILYTDHDMDAAFMRRFRWPMAIYRRVFDMGKRYVQAQEKLDRELYDLSEVHANGIATDMLIERAHRVGFRQVTAGYHWLGLSRAINLGMKALGSPRALPRAWAPLAAIWAVK
jgi:ubiquinone/menaquinone biosynthesis C-methylase UbiE